MIDIGNNVQAVRDRIAAAAARVGRSAEEVSLLAVSKTITPERIDAALAAGISLVGENRVREAADKMPLVKGSAEWHFIGPLQSNKARMAAALFRAIHSLDRPSLVKRLAACADPRRAPLEIYVQVKLRSPESGGTQLQAVRDLCRAVDGTGRLRLKGLMTMAPFDPDPEAARPTFQKLRELRDRIQKGDACLSPLGLSMGMSGDFEVAIEEGATIVRVGTAIFGRRH
ncbi:MAG: YggS family pyridoxal phosphate-dependent enzyme [Acidobacteriota bacterium]